MGSCPITVQRLIFNRLKFQPAEQNEKFRKLQCEKDNLQLQVQVLTEQIDAQTDKIADLEKHLHEKKQQLTDTEDKLQRVSKQYVKNLYRRMNE